MVVRQGNHHPQQDQHQPQFDTLLDELPPVEFSFAYGSGVFQQAGYDPFSTPPPSGADYSNLPMLDLVFAVRNPTEWHRENLEKNRHHYSALRFLGAEHIAAIQEDYGAAMYYNTAVPLPDGFQKGRLMKYGVISTTALRQDLLDWTWLYAAGRMQKPVRVIQPYDGLDQPIATNLLNATKASLLMLPESFTDFELFTMIASISYRGDFRMTFGENPRKVKNIVTGSLPQFHQLYSQTLPLLSSSLSATTTDQTRFTQDMNPVTRAQMIQALPSTLLRHLQSRPRKWETLPAKKTSKLVKFAIHSVIARSSLSQGFKGVFTAGMFKAFSYAWKKIDKMRKGIKEKGQIEKVGGKT